MVEPNSDSVGLYALDMINGITYIGKNPEIKSWHGSGIEPLNQVALSSTANLIADLASMPDKNYLDSARDFYSRASEQKKLIEEIPINLDHIVAPHDLQEQNPE